MKHGCLLENLVTRLLLSGITVMDDRDGLLDVGPIDVAAAGGSSMEDRHALLVTFREDEEEDDFLDAESPQSPSDLDEVVLSAEMAQPLQDQPAGWVQGDVGGEMSMFMDHQAVEDEIMSAERAQRQQKRSVKFKDDGSLVNEFPNERLWSADDHESASDMVGAYIEACQRENIRPIQKLLEQLERLDDLSTPIDTLDLASMRLDYRTCESLEIVLSRLHMSSLDVQKTNIEDDGIIALCEMVEYYECVSRLCLAFNPKIKSRAWLAIGRMLKNSPFIETLNVSYCGLDDQGLTLLLRSVRANCALHTLHLDGNNLSGKGSFILMAAMKFNENLQELHLANNGFLPEDAQNLGGILRTNHTLRVLDIRDNNIQDVGLRQIAVGIAEQQHGLLVLNVSNNNLTPGGMEHMAIMLPCTRSLHEITLSNNRVGDSGLMQLKLPLLANRSLAKLVLINTKVTCEGAIALAEVLAESRMLEHVDLRDNDIRIAGLMALSLAHRLNHHIVHLGIPKNIKCDPRDKEVVAKLFADIEQNTLRNIKEKSVREQQRQEAPDELEEEAEENLEREQAGMDTALPDAVYQGEEEEEDGMGRSTLQEDPFEVVAPVAGEYDKPDERSLDAVLEFEHSLEEDQMEGERSCSPEQHQEESGNSALVEGGFLLDDPYAGSSHLETSVEDVLSGQPTGDEGCTTAGGLEMTERHTRAEPPPHTADLLLNHDTGDDVKGTSPDVPHTGSALNSAGPWLQGLEAMMELSVGNDSPSLAVQHEPHLLD